MASGDVTQILRPSRESTNVWSCYWAGFWEGSPSRSLRPEVAAAAKSEGSTLGKGAILGGMSLQEHTQPGNKSFPGMAQVMGCATGLNCVLGVNGEPKMVSYWQ